MWAVSWNRQEVKLGWDELESYLTRTLTKSGTLIINGTQYIVTAGDITQHNMTYPELHELVLATRLDENGPQPISHHALDLENVLNFIQEAKRGTMWLIRTDDGLHLFQSLAEVVEWLLEIIN